MDFYRLRQRSRDFVTGRDDFLAEDQKKDRRTDPGEIRRVYRLPGRREQTSMAEGTDFQVDPDECGGVDEWRTESGSSKT